MDEEGVLMTPGNWRKSSRSSSQGGSCVEARLAATGPQIRDSKLGDTSPLLLLSDRDLTALLESVR